ncbi:hypothetical protein [Gymnodinialimonas sp.]
MTLSLALTLPMMATTASADGHSCTQLRQGVINNVPVTVRNLPYHALDCAAVGELHLLISRSHDYSRSYLTQRIEAVFRREGLIQ